MPLAGLSGEPALLDGQREHLAQERDDAVGPIELAAFGDSAVNAVDVVEGDVRDLGLPTAPPKPTDKRAFRGQTCQAEAIAPDELARIVRDAIEDRIDRRLLNRVLKREKRERAELVKRLA